jgi:hypothetical protein
MKQMVIAKNNERHRSSQKVRALGLLTKLTTLLIVAGSIVGAMITLQAAR